VRHKNNFEFYTCIFSIFDKIDNKIKSVEFFSPKHKLKCYTGPELDISRNGKIVKGKYAQTKKMGVAIAQVKLDEYSEIEFAKIFQSSKKKDDLSDCYLQALTYISFKQPTKPIKHTKVVVKKQLKEFLDPLIKKCSINLLDKSFKSIHELEFPFEISEPIEDLLSKLSMKKYITLKYNENH
jgi:hypothetical protein